MSCTKEPYVGQDKLQSCIFLMHVKHLFSLQHSVSSMPKILHLMLSHHAYPVLGLAAGWVFTLLSLVENIVIGLPIDFKHLPVAKISSNTVHTNRLNKQFPYISIVVIVYMPYAALVQKFMHFYAGKIMCSEMGYTIL